jgi:Uma2 family endonuclease
MMTVEQFLTLPEDGVTRELVRGRLKERENVLSGRRHARTMASTAGLLESWLETQRHPRGEVLAGGPSFCMRQTPATVVEIDIAYITPEISAANSPDAALIEGPPVLAVEILSPSDKQEDILDKVADYLDCGVKLVWVVEPVFRIVSVYRPDAKPALFNDTQEISGDPHLIGFRAPVREFFDI